jgi:Dyp-type peroxidase family
MLEFDDIQAYIITGYGHKKLSCFLFYEITDAARAKKWLGKLLPRITHARKRDAGEAKAELGVNIIFSAGGLAALGLDDKTLSSFPREFTGGDGYRSGANPMALSASSDLLEDWGDSAPENWHFGGPKTPPAHLVLLLFGTTEDVLCKLMDETAGKAEDGLREVYKQHSNRLGDREAFGFKDGISQPGIEGSYVRTEPGETTVKAGEFILGYKDGYDMLPPSPTVAVANDPANLLPPLTEGQKDLGRNGTFVAVRKLRQKVDAFWGFCTDKTRNPDGSENADKKTFLAAKMIGRWPSGAPIALAPDKDNPALGADSKRNNNFVYSNDPGGMKCPMGSHLRRGNPRDDLPPDDVKTSATVSDRHRIIRRGRPYNGQDGEEQGLMFMALNADIQRQFEFVMQTWINSPKFGHLYENKDPILSDPKLLDPAPGGPTQSVMVIPAEPVRQRISGLQRFVDVRGGGYFFMPGLRALRFLASSPSPKNPMPATPAPESKHPLLKKLWQDVLAVEDKLHDEFLNLRMLLSTRMEHLMANPHLVRPLFTFLREHEPIFVSDKLATISKYDDVVEVLGNEECFSVVDIYADKMKETTGIFVLGMDQTETYQREINWMRAAVKREDIARLHDLALKVTQEQIAAAKPAGKIDLVTSLSRLIPTLIVGEYFGAPGPDIATTQHWMRAIFREIFLDLGNDPTFHKAAVTAGAELQAYLMSVITQRVSQRNAGETLPDDFLSRLVILQATDAELTNETISRLVGGTIVGTVPTNNKAIAQALNELIDRPAGLALTREAAATGNTDLLTKCVFEALRFNPQNPLLLRHCTKDCEIAAGTSRAKVVRKGSLVVVGTESAMFDADKFPQPQEFLVDRPLADYIHFGSGMHTCFGKHIGTMLWPTVLSQVVQLNNLARAEGKEGTIQWDGAFPDHWLLTFSA